VRAGEEQSLGVFGGDRGENWVELNGRVKLIEA